LFYWASLPRRNRLVNGIRKKEKLLRGAASPLIAESWGKPYKINIA
jgi:hypothetical protein